MAIELKVPILNYEQIRERADAFLAKFNPNGTIPVPIEEIAEFSFKVNIIPIPGLQRALEIDGFISSDFRSINVDQFVMEQRERRYRFTLAHEIGHVWLHRDVFSGLEFDTVDGWKRYQTDIGEEAYGWLEWQAYAFGGLVLVPKEALATRRAIFEGQVAKGGSIPRQKPRNSTYAERSPQISMCRRHAWTSASKKTRRSGQRATWVLVRSVRGVSDGADCLRWSAFRTFPVGNTVVAEESACGTNSGAGSKLRPPVCRVTGNFLRGLSSTPAEEYMIAEMSDSDLLARLVNFEDQFVERKTVADLNDSLKTVVGFANSAPVGMPCVLYIGVKDDGQFEDRQHDFDSVQKTLNRLLQRIYPRAAYFPKLLTKGGRTALAVLVPGSELRPHFSGPSYVRRGSETIEASQSQFDGLVAMRSGKVYRLMQHVGKQVTVVNMSLLGNGTFMRGNWGTVPTIVDCNEFWVTLQSPGEPKRSFCLRDVELNFDDQRSRLQLEITTREL